ncbi:MAG TPA: PHB depolymerase family esterase [Candidatus Hydrogenedens sp.]|nr:PHB depolymerase family esterase [Candidatus Hydrogenedens sp.]
MIEKKKRLFIISGSTLSLFSILIIFLFTSCYAGYSKIKVDGETRYYRLHIPPNLDSTTPVPLLLALHQFSDTARGMEKLTRFNQLADEEKFIVVYPQGKWRTWKTAPLPNKDTRFLEVLIDYLLSRYPIQTNQIFATGASAGGMMIQAFACYSKRFAAIAPVMGSMTQIYAEERKPQKNIPVLIIHGTADPVVPFNGGETNAGPGKRPVFLSAEENAEWWAKQYGYSGETIVTQLPDSNTEDTFYTEVVNYNCVPSVFLYKIIGGGHTWPGTKNFYPQFIVGPTAPEPDASKLIWDFFKNAMQQM